MTAATKTKTKKVEDLYPPREIREITKARREWLAATVAEVNARPGFSGKIVGNGSYQSVSVYSVTQVEGRLRHRGHCQFCGNSQVVQDGVMVLHGYTRPGDGYIFNECPCVGKAPLEIDQMLANAYLGVARGDLARLEEQLANATTAHESAQAAKYGNNYKREVERNAYTEMPHAPRTRYASQAPFAEEVATYRAAMKVWTKKFPLTAAVEKTKQEVSQLSNLVWREKQQVEHFETLLGWKLLGKPLTEEVVA
jgi:hypothetical protein